MGYPMYGGGFDDAMFNIVPAIVAIGFIVVLGIIIATAIKGLKEWNTNNESPVLTVVATVVAKRAHVSTSVHHNNGTHHRSSSTTYYATFEVESGDRMELNLPDKEYGILLEGDNGKLTFQGTRYKGFERIR